MSLVDWCGCAGGSGCGFESKERMKVKTKERRDTERHVRDVWCGVGGWMDTQLPEKHMVCIDLL